jgi:hypothetical protein
METTIEMSDKEVCEIVRKHMAVVLGDFAKGRDIYVAAKGYSGLSLRIVVADAALDEGEKE